MRILGKRLDPIRLYLTAYQCLGDTQNGTSRRRPRLGHSITDSLLLDGFGYTDGTVIIALLFLA